MTVKALLYAYVLGGLTFIPLVVAAALYYIVYTSVPVEDSDTRKKRRAELAASAARGDDAADAARPRDVNDAPKTRKAWLTMRRTYEESSIDGGYVTLVRSFLDARSKDPKRSRPKDMWYVVLKGKILYLYEDEAMTECEAAIELGSHDVIIYPEGIPDGELFAKRNAICLKPKLPPPQEKGMPSVTKQMDLEKVDVDAKLAESGVKPHKAEKERDVLLEEARLKEEAREEAMDVATPWFIFVRANCEMEDWYLALIHASDNSPQTPLLTPLQPVFLPSDMNHLVNTLDEKPDVIPMRWLNALIGRVFFSFYRTHTLEDEIIRRIMKKLSKVKRPTFLTDIVVTEVSVGNKAPTFSKPMLKELTKEGDASLEVHMQYKGEFRITIEATATINLGSRFKPYSVKIVLAVVLKEIEGNVLLKIKRPPSNRIWYAFTQTPKMVFEVEPIVSERQITWNMITSTLELKLKEIIQESVVLPNMDDISFFESINYGHRGGIWADAARREKPPSSVSDSSVSQQVLAEDASVASVPLPDPPSAEADTSNVRPTQSAAELVREDLPSSSPPDVVDLAWSSSLSSGDDATSAYPVKRKSWFAGARNGDFKLSEQDDSAEEELQRGRSVDTDKSTTPRSRSTPNATSDPPPSSEDGGNDSPLQTPTRPSRSSSIWSHNKSNSTEESTKTSSEPSTSYRNGLSPSSSSFLSTLRSRDKQQVISNAAKETVRKWSANWTGLMKDSGNKDSGNGSAGDEMPDHGSVSRLRPDSFSGVPQKARTSYAEVRAAVAERRGKERGSESSSPGGSSPIPIPEVKRERAVTMEPGKSSQNEPDDGSSLLMARSATVEGSSSSNLLKPPPSPSSIARQISDAPQPVTPSSPSPIHVQPQAKMMTIPGIHASHRGEVMSMGYVAPKPPSPSPDARTKNPAIQSVYRLWKSPASAEATSSTASPEAVVASSSSSTTSSSSSIAPTDEGSKPALAPPVVSFPPLSSPTVRPAPPPLPPRTVRTTSVSNVSRPELSPRVSSSESLQQPSASEALQSIAKKDKRVSAELGLGLPSSPPSRRSTLSSTDRTSSSSSIEVSPPPIVVTSNPGPPLPPR